MQLLDFQLLQFQDVVRLDKSAIMLVLASVMLGQQSYSWDGESITIYRVKLPIPGGESV